MPTVALSHFVIDLPTLCAATVFVAMTGGLLLLMCWLQNRSEPSLGFWSLGYLLGSAAAALVASGGIVPAAWSVGAANTLICGAYGILWGGARSFEGRPINLPLMIAGAAVFVAACQVPGFYASVPARVGLVSLILATYTFLSASEVWRARDPELISRWPTFALLLVHGVILLARFAVAGALQLPATSGVHRTVIFVMGFEALFTAFCLAFLRVSMAKERAELAQRRAAATDPLTGVANRRAFFENGSALLARCAADRRNVALLLFDLDRFKELNDTAGHQAGDRVLRIFSDLVTATMRPGDLFGRLGGEEFAWLLADASMAEALRAAERVRHELATLHLPDSAVSATVSVGLAMASEADPDLQSLFAAADRALYRAKAEGRNRVARAPLVLIGSNAGSIAPRSPAETGVAMAVPQIN